MESATAPLLIDPPLALQQSEPVADVQPASKRRPLPRLRPGWLVVGIVFLAVAGGLLYLRAWPPMATVMSDSMSPTIETGDVVVLRHLERAPRARDVIAVRVPDAARSRYGYPPIVIHRVVKVARNGDITTKGDARQKPDPFTVRRHSAESRVVATIPSGGHLVAFFTSTVGLVWLAGGVLLLLVLPLVERNRDLRDREEETLEGLRSELRAISDELALLRSGALPAAVDPAPADPVVAEMGYAVDEYLYCFETELSSALDELAREIELS
jgi:signal peptidase I